ncbi:MAG: NfeD family protein, partial [Gammaproteobacteria bacterium]|nr:NfeD family protein [Gammaproteobacteria bacterium]
MTTITDPFIWIALAVLLALAEIIVPGGVVFFLGASSAIVAISLWLGFVTTWVNALSLFFISSLVLIVSFRAVVSRFAEGDSHMANTEEILDEIDEIVEVLDT